MNRITIAVAALMGALTSAAPLPDGEERRLGSESETILDGNFTKHGLDDEIGTRRLQAGVSYHKVTPGEIDILTNDPLPDEYGRRLSNVQGYDRLGNLSDLFDYFDENKDGSIDMQELYKFLEHVLDDEFGEFTSSVYHNELKDGPLTGLMHFDEPGVSYDQSTDKYNFMRIVSGLELADKIGCAFDAINTNKRPDLQRDELVDFFKLSLGERFRPRDAKHMRSHFDDHVSKNAFILHMQSNSVAYELVNAVDECRVKWEPPK